MATITGGKTPDMEARLAARSPNGRRPVLMHQRWEALLFLHWQVDPEYTQQTLPPGLTVDTFEGRAYLGITPFFMLNVRPATLPALPWISFFQELNVRTYVFDSSGAPGIWFYSLDCNRLVPALLARFFGGLPYCLASMNAVRGERIDYYSRRRGTSDPARYQYRPAGPDHETAAESLEFFVLERYYFFAYRHRRRRLLRAQVSHLPYRFHDVEMIRWSTTPAELAGFSDLAESPDHVCFADGFDVEIFAQEKL
jgi:uncharacterized protein